VEFTLVSPDGDMGFPGTLTAHVRYTLMGESLRIDYSANTTKPTVLNLTNHTYFNLEGEDSGNVLGQELMLNAERFTPISKDLIPTGALRPVEGTPFDFRKLTPIGARIATHDRQLKFAGGYDQNFVLEGEPGKMHLAAFAMDPVSGRTLTVITTEPGVQFYSGNFLAGTVKGYSGHLYEKHAGFALETQHFPDSPNHPDFPSTTLLPGHEWHSSTMLRFGVAPASDDALRAGKSN
jgi:aldose 1-epimerase